MKLLCIFRGNKLLNQYYGYHESNASRFKETTANEFGLDINELEAVVFEDSLLNTKQLHVKSDLDKVITKKAVLIYKRLVTGDTVLRRLEKSIVGKLV